ncbi:siphovirus ReqiPepy6 Gp37-like family protein [Microtetraspora malaysiensis]|uniref:siphovirus ReqiPepy6 Gp37-like family protein n=1 Tax=Microtetraspora malaysiensis TaxID=161358 RepID=UPI003D90CA79
MPKFLIETRDRDLRRTGVIEHYTVLDVIPRYCDVGSWTVTVPAGSADADLLQPGHGVVIWTEGYDKPVLSGSLEQIKHSWSAGDPGQGSVTFSGRSDEVVLWSRATYPQPDRSVTEQTADTYSVSAPAGRAITDIVNLNAGPGARASRRVRGLTVTPSGDGPAVQFTSRFDVLGERCRSVALAAGLGFRAVQTATDEIGFEVFIPRDRSETVVFSKDRNLREFEYTMRAPEAQRFFLAAQGEGSLRYILPFIQDTPGSSGVVPDVYETSNSSEPPTGAWYTYWTERFLDRRDIPLAYNESRQVIVPETEQPATPEELAAMPTAANEGAVDFAESAALSITPIQTPDLVFGRDYMLGDRVSVEINGVYLTDILREVRLSDSNTEGPSIRPVIGTDDSTETPFIYQQVRKLWANLRQLESRR